MLSQLVLADLQKQIAQEVRNVYVKSFVLKKKKKKSLSKRMASFFSIHSPPLISIGKNTPGQNKSSQREN